MDLKKELSHPFNADRQLKTRLAYSMWTDSNDFLYRVRKMLEPDLETYSFSIKSKIYVDILMAIESDLKSLIISLSKKSESPEDAYLVARNFGHNIQKLFDEVERRAKFRVKLLSPAKKKDVINKYIKLRVSNRYKLITLLNLRSENVTFRLFDSGLYSSLLTFPSIDSFRKLSTKLHSIALTSIERNMDGPFMSGSNWGKLENRLKIFESNLGNKI